MTIPDKYLVTSGLELLQYFYQKLFYIPKKNQLIGRDE